MSRSVTLMEISEISLCPEDTETYIVAGTTVDEMRLGSLGSGFSVERECGKL